MDITVDGKNLFAATGGKDFDPAQPSIVFVHGGGLDHTTWVLQTRYFSYHGYNVLAVDMPGHGRSEGPMPASVEDTADWIMRLFDALELDQAALVGHSTGSLVTFVPAAHSNQVGLAHGDRHFHLGCVPRAAIGIVVASEDLQGVTVIIVVDDEVRVIAG